MGSDVTKHIVAAIRSAPDRRVPTLRVIQRKISGQERSGDAVLKIARQLVKRDDVPRWIVYELIHHHDGAMAKLNAAILSELWEGTSSWGEVDPFACYLSGVAWREEDDRRARPR